MDSSISIVLREYGLAENEIVAYIYLVSRGGLTAYQVAKGTKMLRSNMYNILARLVEKGFVGESISDGRKLYYANDLRAVIARIKNKEVLLESLVPKIEVLRVRNKTEVFHAQAKNSFAQFNKKLFDLAANKALSFCYMISNSPDLRTASSIFLSERLLTDLYDQRLLVDVDVRAIWDVGFKDNDFVNHFIKLGKNKFLDSLPSKATMFLYDGHVAFLYLDDSDSFIEIKSGIIVEELKSYFEYLWAIALE